VVAYAVVIAGSPSLVYFVVRSNQADGMAGIPYAVGAAGLLYFMILPSLVGIGIWEVDRRKALKARRN
jgi:hypothetical protein